MQRIFEDLPRLTLEYGKDWGINHTQRLLKLISSIGKGQKYDPDVVWLAAHLHDWGAYPFWAQKDVDHALRSSEVAKSWLAERGCPPQILDQVIESISLHHNPDIKTRSIESILLYDADALDFLGVIGIVRDFSKNPRELRKAYDISIKRRQTLPGTLFLNTSITMAVERINEMDQFFFRLDQETWGDY